MTGTRRSTLDRESKLVLARARKVGLANAAHLLLVELQRRHAAGIAPHSDSDGDPEEAATTTPDPQQAFAQALARRAPVISKDTHQEAAP